jgi:hypothetical protein
LQLALAVAIRPTPMHVGLQEVTCTTDCIIRSIAFRQLASESDSYSCVPQLLLPAQCCQLQACMAQVVMQHAMQAALHCTGTCRNQQEPTQAMLHTVKLGSFLRDTLMRHAFACVTCWQEFCTGLGYIRMGSRRRGFTWCAVQVFLALVCIGRTS